MELVDRKEIKRRFFDALGDPATKASVEILAQAVDSAHVIESRPTEPCEYCCDGGGFSMIRIIDKIGGRPCRFYVQVFDNRIMLFGEINGVKFSDERKINYCPMCGRYIGEK
jgi:hypothetical protein